MLILSQRDVHAVLDMARLIDALAEAMIDLSAGRASVPPRVGASVVDPPGILAAMPAYLPSSDALAAKLVSVFPDNVDQPTHQALICCFDPTTGRPIAVMDGTSITGARTAACSALATRALAAVGSRVVAIVGTGVQARAHVDALRVVLPDARIVVAGRDAERAATFADAIGTDAAPSIEAAVQAADVVCVATHAEAPVLRREWLHAGAHVNSVGYNTTGTGEVDRHTVRDAYVVVESRASTLAPPPAGAVELRSALDDGAMSHDVAELGEVLSGERPGRTDAAQLTLYKSVGVAVQDAAAAMLVLADARSRGLGVEVAI